MPNFVRTTRRSFLGRTSAAMAAAMGAPMVLPQRAFGANEKIVTGHIGTGGMGRGNLNRLLDHAAAVCDVDRQHAAQAAEMVHKKHGKCDVYGDFRKLLDRKDIDAVVVSTPDHWHALPTVRACEAGKHVYCEKPLTLTIVEGRKIVEAARANNAVVQTGSQQRSSGNFRLACELVRNGRIGRVTKVEVGIPGCNHPGALGPDGEPPEQLDYDFWLGPAPWRAYNAKRVHYNFRFWLDYSGGQMTNWGAHHLDIAHWGLGADESGPIDVDGTATFDAEKRFDVPAGYDIVFTYPGEVKVHIGQKYRGGTTFHGTEGSIHVNRGRLESTPDDIIQQPLGDDDLRLTESSNHHRNWLDCIKTGTLPICDAEIGHRTATACHLANLCALLGRKLRWDSAKEQFLGDDEANSMRNRPYRAPWKL